MDDYDDSPPPISRPWIHLDSSGDIEGWIESYNRDLRRTLNPNESQAQSQSFGLNQGQGICFVLAAGGEIYLHTTGDGDVLLDVTPEAEWAAPVIVAATGIPAPSSQIWALPAHALTQLVMGLSMLIESTRIVTRYDFRKRRY